ncbi:MAG: DUF1554 domain-containing protein [Deltaproteobacteria bacterium]|nr:DUF1554 domain-containing protein [Deltaproteobacteria bacterium]
MRLAALFTPFHFLFLVGLLIVGCGESSESETDTEADPEAATTYTIGGTLSGLTGTVVLQNNTGDDLTLTADGSFTFATGLEDAETYQVTVSTPPDGLTCSVSSGTGTVDGADVTDVSIVCSADTYTVGGTVTGLSGTVVLQNNATDDLTLAADGSFTFSAAVADGAGYAVTVKTQPSGLTCSASNNSGTMSGANVTNVTIVCSANTYTVGGTLSGLSGTVVLQNNNGNNLSLTTNGSFTFSTAVADGAAYSVTVKTQPSGASCSVASGTGTISGANVTTVTVTCAANTYTVGGTLSGVSGTVVLQNTSGNDLSLTTNGTFTFSTALIDGASYSVAVSTQPSRQSCTVSSASGTISSANITSVTVACVNVRKTFVTATTDGNLKDGAANGIAGADAKCESDGSKPADGSTYKAFLVDTSNRVACTTASCGGGTSEHTDWVMGANTTYTRSDGTTVVGVTNANGILATFPLTNSFGTSAGLAWTGLSQTADAWTSGNGSVTDSLCNNWESADDFGYTADLVATSGYNNAVSKSAGGQGCSTSRALICVEQ